MIKNVFLSSCFLLSVAVFLLSNNGVHAEAKDFSYGEDVPSHIVETTIFDFNQMKFITISPQAILTRYWTSGWTTTGNPAPAVAFFQSGAYRGWLGKYREMPVSNGTRGYYEGYFYHHSLPLPILSKINFREGDI
ncbi:MULTISPECIES: hypothetical protein [Enterococcus]|uniref:Uncharacterized protein n=1 Tax=Enterococcus faecium TaxID=1352 RepID=A0AAI8LIY1_ENTFC|nr:MULTISPECIES: hypothetical protein [Enterococcus]AII40297.1 hypothetical protein M395_03255 [Enterococcus faecium T110]AYM72346.1 hypothetical protein D9Z05_03310 [Enterococcus faecium]EGP5688572.1 hypothetical protein [Enterococcus faecium]EME8087434.1 hypothetical protein [Enterococcus faecium]EME8198879.1 hypothetical protein [Enterococcus faecium]